MYEVKDNGVLKLVESWNVVIPSHDNEGVLFKESLIDQILQEILLNYPGFSRTNLIGYWKGIEKTYIDKNIHVMIDTLPENVEDSSIFFAELKIKLQKKLKQEKIYITKQDAKKELLSFDEFFEEIGLELDSNNSEQDIKNIVKKLANNFDFVLQRLGYETISVIRNKETGKIIWERKMCGVIIKSEIDDFLHQDFKIISADQFEKLGEAFFEDQPFAIIGSYEYLSFILQKRNKRSLVKVDETILQNVEEIPFISQAGEMLSNKMFIEEFTMSIFNNILILRDEGFQSNDISINVGKDGSMQHAQNEKGSVLLHCPAIITNEIIQKEILRCISVAISEYENNSIDAFAVLQTKAKNNYTLKRAFVHHTLRNI